MSIATIGIVYAERLGGREARQHQNKAVKTLAARLVQIHNPVEAYDQGCAGRSGLLGRVPRDPVSLQQLVQRVMSRIQAGGFRLPTTALSGIQLDAAALLEDLRGPFADPRSALAQGFDDARNLAGSHEAKDDAVRIHDGASQPTAHMLAKHLLYAGMEVSPISSLALTAHPPRHPAKPPKPRHPPRYLPLPAPPAQTPSGCRP